MKMDPVDYFEKRKIKEFYFEMTDIVRQFLGANYHIDTMDKTSLEITEELERWNGISTRSNYRSLFLRLRSCKIRQDATRPGGNEAEENGIGKYR